MAVPVVGTSSWQERQQSKGALMSLFQAGDCLAVELQSDFSTGLAQPKDCPGPACQMDLSENSIGSKRKRFFARWIGPKAGFAPGKLLQKCTFVPRPHRRAKRVGCFQERRPDSKAPGESFKRPRRRLPRRFFETSFEKSDPRRSLFSSGLVVT